MLTFHRTFRDHRNITQFAVLVDNVEHRVLVTKWDAANDRIERLADIGYTSDGTQSQDRHLVLAEAAAVARQLSDTPDVAFADALADVRARRQAEDQVVARRPDARDGTCIVCGRSMRAHFTRDNRKVPCAEAARRESPA